MTPDRPSLLRRWIRITSEEEATVFRVVRYTLWFFAVCLLVLIPLIRSGYFKDQARQKQARRLVETGGYAYCAIWGDGTDPFQLMSPNSPNLPRWTGQRQFSGAYVMTLTYRRSGKEYRHQWEVDLSQKRVKTLTDSRTPLSTGETERACTER